MKALFIGTGGIGARHARNVHSLVPNAELIAVREMPNEISEELSITLVPTLADGIACQPDFAVVALPPAEHASVAMPLIEARVPIYLEKPVAMTIEQIEPVVERAIQDDIVTMVGCNLRMCGGFQKIRALIQSGELGPVRHGRLSVGQWLPDWRPGQDYRNVFSSKRALGGGVLLELIHEFDLARYLFGDFEDVSAHAGNTGVLEMDVEDHGDAILSRGDMTVVIHMDCLDRAGTRQGRIVCEEGTISYDTTKQVLECFDSSSGKWTSMYETDDFNAVVALKEAMSHFIDCIRNGCQTNQPLSEGRATLALSQAARTSAGILS